MFVRMGGIWNWIKFVSNCGLHIANGVEISVSSTRKLRNSFVGVFKRIITPIIWNGLIDRYQKNHSSYGNAGANTRIKTGNKRGL
jgi:hypothetical protein